MGLKVSTSPFMHLRVHLLSKQLGFDTLSNHEHEPLCFGDTTMLIDNLSLSMYDVLVMFDDQTQ